MKAIFKEKNEAIEKLISNTNTIQLVKTQAEAEKIFTNGGVSCCLMYRPTANVHDEATRISQVRLNSTEKISPTRLAWNCSAVENEIPIDPLVTTFASVMSQAYGNADMVGDGRARLESFKILKVLEYKTYHVFTDDPKHWRMFVNLCTEVNHLNGETVGVEERVAVAIERVLKNYYPTAKAACEALGIPSMKAEVEKGIRIRKFEGKFSGASNFSRLNDDKHRDTKIAMDALLNGSLNNLSIEEQTDIVGAFGEYSKSHKLTPSVVVACTEDIQATKSATKTAQIAAEPIKWIKGVVTKKKMLPKPRKRAQIARDSVFVMLDKIRDILVKGEVELTISDATEAKKKATGISKRLDKFIK